MSKLQRISPCHDCPVRRNSRAGWLGSDTPGVFLAKTQYGDGDMPCHTAIDYTDPDWVETQLPDSPYCAGGLQYLSNQGKVPRDPELAAACRAVGRNRDVFAWPEEFLSHHFQHPIAAAESYTILSCALDSFTRGEGA